MSIQWLNWNSNISAGPKFLPTLASLFFLSIWIDLIHAKRQIDHLRKVTLAAAYEARLNTAKSAMNIN